MFQVGIYKRDDINSPTRLLLLKEREGFIFDSSEHKDCSFGDNWIKNFSILDEDFFLSTDNVKEIRKHSLAKNVEEFLLKHTMSFSVIKNFLISKDQKEILKISILDKISKIDDNSIFIHYSGKTEKIRCSEFDKLKQEFMNVKEVF